MLVKANMSKVRVNATKMLTLAQVGRLGRVSAYAGNNNSRYVS